jgi:hypothetical protein
LRCNKCGCIEVDHIKALHKYRTVAIYCEQCKLICASNHQTYCIDDLSVESVYRYDVAMVEMNLNMERT